MATVERRVTLIPRTGVITRDDLEVFLAELDAAGCQGGQVIVPIGGWVRRVRGLVAHIPRFDTPDRVTAAPADARSDWDQQADRARAAARHRVVPPPPMVLPLLASPPKVVSAVYPRHTYPGGEIFVVPTRRTIHLDQREAP